MSNITKKSDLPGFFSDFFEDVDSFFNRDWVKPWRPMMKVPAANVKEGKDSFTIELAVPGMGKGDFNISVENNTLMISSEKEENKEETEENYTKREYSFSSFKRSFLLPDSAKAEDITATYAEGVLNVVVPKKEETKTEGKKTIEVS